MSKPSTPATPAVVRRAMLAVPVEICGITLHPLNLDITWALEEVGSPLLSGGANELTPLQIAQVVFAFAAPSEALDAAAAPREEGERLTTYDRAALAFVRAKVPDIRQLPAIATKIGELIKQTLDAAPGGGANPRAAGA